VRRSLGVFLVGLGMETARLHRPTILRMRADTTSPGMPCTLPLRISCVHDGGRVSTLLSFAGMAAGATQFLSNAAGILTLSPGRQRPKL
jgi:hypothetical protein